MRCRATGFTASICVVTVVVAFGLGTLTAVQQARAVTIELPLSANGQAKSTDQTNFFINYPANPVYTDWTPNDTPIQEQRGVLEFDLAGLPDVSYVWSANLLFDVSLIETSSFGSTTFYPSLTIWSYGGNNAIDVSDATMTVNALATLTVDDTGPVDVALDPTHIRGVVGDHPAALGILTYANSQDLTVGIWTSAFPPSIAAPRVVLTYAPAGDANLDDRVDADDYALVDRGYALQLAGWGNGDFNDDGAIDQQDYLILDTAYGQSQALSPEFLAERAGRFGDAYVATLQAAVPEPSAAGALLLVASSGLLGGGRRRRSRS